MTKTLKNQSFTHPYLVPNRYVFISSLDLKGRDAFEEYPDPKISFDPLFYNAENNSTNKDTMETCRTVTSS